jgi:hypothetical protein
MLFTKSGRIYNTRNKLTENFNPFTYSLFTMEKKIVTLYFHYFVVDE